MSVVFHPKIEKKEQLHICLPTMGIFIYKKNSIVIIHSFVTKKCLSGQNGKLILLHFSMYYFLIHLLYCTCMYLCFILIVCIVIKMYDWTKWLLLLLLFYFFCISNSLEICFT